MHEICVTPFCGLREPFSALSHLLAAGIFAALGVRLVTRTGRNRGTTASLAVFSYTTVQMLLMSSLYHLHGSGPQREFFLRADVAGIFLLIAGCLTPIHVILFRGPWRWAPLILTWTVAVVGATLKLSVSPGTPGPAGIALLLLFGWGSVVTAIKLWRDRGWAFVQTPVLSGLIYTVGAVLLMLNQPTLIPGVIGPHDVWHIAVLCAHGMHWRFIVRIAAMPDVEDATVLEWRPQPPAASDAGSRRRAA